VSQKLNTTKQNIDKEKILRFLPKGTSHKVTDEIIRLVNQMGSDEVEQEYFEEKFLSYLHVLGDKGIRASLRDYINALKFCTYKKNMSNERAWELTFPDKYERLEKLGKQVSNHVAMYNGNPLVTKLDALMLTEEHIQYAPLFHEAIMKEAQLMRGIGSNGERVSPHVQHMAASTLIDKLAPPKEDKLSITVGLDEATRNTQVKVLEELSNVAKSQRELLEQGYSLAEVQKLNLKSHDIQEAEIDE
jgi:hypothetical protein